MAKRPLGAPELFDLRQALHLAVIEALMSSRRWEPADLIFRGGTSLHLVHGSPRFSEDLDFLVRSSLNLDSLSDAVRLRLKNVAWLPSDAALTVTRAKDGRNPHAFVVSIGGPSVIGSVRVKVELWRAPREAMAPLSVRVSPVRLASGPAAGMQAFVPAAEMHEIYADKVFALGARPYLKARDVFDIHWLIGRGVPPRCTAADLKRRLAAYPDQKPAAWIEKARARRTELQAAGPAISRDLKRWLPSAWPINEQTVAEMIDTTTAALEQGIDQMRALEKKPPARVRR
jgi:predicted nucleotidyltransferase component of viral defense system